MMFESTTIAARLRNIAFVSLFTIALAACGGEDIDDTIPGNTSGESTGGNTGTETGGNTGSETGGDTGSQTGGDTGSETGGDTGSQTGGDTGSQTGGDTGSETGGDTGSQTGGDTGSQTGGDTGSQTGGDTGSETGGDTGSETGGDTGSETGGDTGSETGGDTGSEPTPDPALLELTSNSVTFSATQGEDLPAAKTVSFSSTTSEEISWSTAISYEIGNDWLILSASSGTTPSVLEFSVNAQAEGVYKAQVTVSGIDSDVKTIDVQYTVVAQEEPALLSISQNSLNFDTIENEALPSAQSLQISSSKSENIDWISAIEYESGSNWLTISDNSGTTPSSISISVNEQNRGVYKANVIISGEDDDTQTVSVQYTVTEALKVELSISEDNLVFSEINEAKTVALTSANGSTSWSVDVQYNEGNDWLSLENTSGASTPADIDVSVNQTLIAGVYSALLTFTGEDGIASVQTNVQYTSSAEELVLTIDNATASTSEEGADHGPEKAIDGNKESDSRWSALGIQEWLDIDLGTAKTFSALDILFHKNDTRSTCFNLFTSNDKQNWVSLRANLRSKDESSDTERFYVNETAARYIRYEGLGNSDNDWNSLTEIDVVLSNTLDDVETADGETIDTCKEEEPGGTDSGSTGGADGSTGGEDGSTGGADGSTGGEDGSTGGTDGSTGGDDGSTTGGEPGAAIVIDDLDSSKSPTENFDLFNWKITYPDASEKYPAAVQENEFYTGADGAMVFQCINKGEQTSNQTKYPRSELRQMLRGDNTRIGTKDLGNNWVIDETSLERMENAGGVNGYMKATVAVDYVSRDYNDSSMVGRVIVGQIHGVDDEPVKIYYRKLPGNELGSIYWSYEEPGEDGKDIYYEIIGKRSSSASNPSDGIALGEKWGYEIDVKGREMTVTITRKLPDGTFKKYVDSHTWDSEYDDDMFYFKAGVYNQNNGGDDFAQASFYHLEFEHDYSYKQD